MEEELKGGKGIYDTIREAPPVEYRKLTKELLEKFMLDICHSRKNPPRIINFTDEKDT